MMIDFEDLRRANRETAELGRQTAELVKQSAEREIERSVHIGLELTDMRDSIRTLTTTTGQLLKAVETTHSGMVELRKIAEAHESRLARLERKSA